MDTCIALFLYELPFLPWWSLHYPPMKRFLSYFISFLLFIVISVVITYPLLFHLTNYVSGLGDELILTYIQRSVMHNLSTNPLHLFETMSYFPYHNSLAYSDSLITSSIIYAFPAFLFNEPIAIHNLDLIFSLASLGWSVFLLSKYITKDISVSLVTGILTVLSPVVLDKYIHLQVLFCLFVPLSIYFFFRYIEGRNLKFFYLSILCFILQTLNSFLMGYFALFSLATITIVAILQKKRPLQFFINAKTMAVSIISLTILLPFVLPYYQVSKEFGYTRDIRDSIHFANQPEDFLYTSQFSRLAPFFNDFWHRASYPSSISFKNGFPGTVFLIFTFFSVYYLLRNWQLIDYKIKALLYSSLIGVVLSLGPFLHINRQTIHTPFPIPLPYLPLYYLLPGFNGMRNSARWEVLFIICMSVVIGYVLSQVFRKYSSPRKALVAIILIALVVLEYQPSIDFVRMPQLKDAPREYSYINSIQSAKVVEMPIYNWNTFPYSDKEYLRQYYSLINFAPRVNGVSGFSPPPWQDFVVSQLKSFPSPESLKELKKIGVNTIIVHPQDYDEMAEVHYKVSGVPIPSSSTVLRQLDASPYADKLQSYSTGVIYHLK